MASATLSRELMKVLTTPSKIASALDWKKQIGGSIATIDVHADRIGLSISHHPSNTSSSSSCDEESSSSSTLSSSSVSYSLPIRKKGKYKIPDSSRQQLSELVRENKVCGFVVSWPIQKDTGLMGASCGRTLFAIEELLSQPSEQSSEQSSKNNKATTDHSSSSSNSSSPIFTANRKICLWDGIHEEQPKADLFGRSSVYARTSTKKEYRASTEQYHQDESIVATTVWEDFVKTNWPEIYQQQIVSSMTSSDSGNSNNNKINKEEEEEEQQQEREQDEEYHHQQQRRSLVAA